MNNEIKKILESYNSILETKKIIKEFNTIKLNDTHYSNVKYDNDQTKYDSVNTALLDDIQTAAKNAGIIATITTAKSGHSEKTASNNASRHMSGAGVDVGLLNGIGSDNATDAKNGNPTFRELGNKLKDELVKLGYTWNTESGNPKAVLWQTNVGGNHFNHVHISNNSDAVSSSNSGNTSDDFSVELVGAGDKFIADIGTQTAKSLGLKEQKEFGKNVTVSFDTATIPSKSNSKIRTPVSGVVNNSTYDPRCKNQIRIETNYSDRKYYQFCNITNPMVRNNQKVSSGTVIGETSDDVTLVIYNNRRQKVKIHSSKNYGDEKINNTDDDTDNKNKKEKKPKTDKEGFFSKVKSNLPDKRYDDPAIAALIDLPVALVKSIFTGGKKSSKLKEDIDRIKGLL
jgi:hypothetical protein